MKVISHRGNLYGPNPEKENHPDYIKTALSLVGWCEIDLWVRENGELWLGHDMPQYQITIDFINENASYLYIHCKNFLAFNYCIKNANQNWNYFWHQEDDYTLTSGFEIWAYPKKGLQFTNNVILALPEVIDNSVEYQDKLIDSNIGGVCTDFAMEWEEKSYVALCNKMGWEIEE